MQPDPPLTPPPPVGPPPPPKISLTLKYFGFFDVPAVGKAAVEKVAAFTDCRSTMRGKEGDIIDGRYRLVRIRRRVGRHGVP